MKRGFSRLPGVGRRLSTGERWRTEIRRIWPIRCDRQRASTLPGFGVCSIRSGASVERRKWPRLPLAIPVFVKSRDDNGKEFLEFATALNISAAGALVAVRRPLPPSSQLLLEIPSAPLAATARLPKASRALRAKCVRVTHAEGYYLAGLKFSRPLLAEQKEKQPSRQRKAGTAHVKRFSPLTVPAPA